MDLERVISRAKYSVNPSSLHEAALQALRDYIQVDARLSEHRVKY